MIGAYAKDLDSRRQAHADFCDLVDAALHDKPGLVLSLRAYFDESLRDGGTLTVAGYLYTSAQAKNFEAPWREMLGPYEMFHMADLNAGDGIYKGIDPALKGSMTREAVRIVNQYSSAGVAVACNSHEFKELCPKGYRYHRDPYVMLCNMCLIAISQIIEAAGIGGQVTYWFEAGHRCEGDADRLMTNLYNNPILRERLRYASHAFVPKDHSVLLQSADLLAWEWGKHIDEPGRRPMRKSLEALLNHPNGTLRCAPMNKEAMAKYFELSKQADYFPDLFRL